VFVIRYSADGIWRRGLSTIINFVTMCKCLDRNSGTPIPKKQKRGFEADAIKAPSVLKPIEKPASEKIG